MRDLRRCRLQPASRRRGTFSFVVVSVTPGLRASRLLIIATHKVGVPQGLGATAGQQQRWPKKSCTSSTLPSGGLTGTCPAPTFVHRTPAALPISRTAEYRAAQPRRRPASSMVGPLELLTSSTRHDHLHSWVCCWFWTLRVHLQYLASNGR